MAVEGDITIEIKASTDKFDKQIANLEKKMKKEENRKIEIQADLSGQEQEFQRAIEKTDKLADAYQRVKQLQDIISQGKATPGQFTELQGLQNTYGTLEKIDNSFNKALDKQDAIQQKVANLRNKYEEVGKSVDEYKQKIENVKIQKQVADVEKLKSGFNSVGSSIQGAVKHVAKLALGIFAVRSASSDLASYDQQYAANLEYIRYALTQAVAPALRYIVSLAATLLQYIYAILNAWFGIGSKIDVSAKSFNKMKAGASGVSKAVKEIKKQLAGFDEINMLTDQSNTGTSGGAGGVGMPSFDLSSLEGERPEWMQWILDHAPELIPLIFGIVGALIALKAGFTPLQSLGIGMIIDGVIYAIESLKDYLEDPTLQNLGKIFQGIGIAIAGVGLAIGGTAGAIVAAVGAFIFIAGTVIKYWDQIKASMQSTIDYIRKNWGPIGIFIADIMQGVLDFFDIAINWIKDSFDGIIEFFKGVFAGDWGKAWEGIKKIFNATWEAIKSVFKVFGEFVYNVTIKPVEKIFGGLWESIKTGAKNAWNWITGIFRGIGDWFGNLINTIIGKFRDMGAKVGQVVSGAFKGVVNGILGAVERILNTPIRAINSLISVINKVPGVSLGTLRTFSLPRLAVGGIVNMPNKGTLVGGALAGESGREGVLPLTDQQAMSEIGKEIGKWVNINATIPINIGNRQVAREVRRINAEDDFAYNS